MLTCDAITGVCAQKIPAHRTIGEMALGFLSLSSNSCHWEDIVTRMQPGSMTFWLRLNHYPITLPTALLSS
jgi:hypothetical protein